MPIKRSIACSTFRLIALLLAPFVRTQAADAQGIFASYTLLQRNDDADQVADGLRLGVLGRIASGVNTTVSCAYYPNALRRIPVAGSTSAADCVVGLEYDPFDRAPVGLVFQAAVGGISVPEVTGATLETLGTENRSRFVALIGAGLRAELLKGFAADAHVIFRRDGSADDIEIRLGLAKHFGNRVRPVVRGAIITGTTRLIPLKGSYRARALGVNLSAARDYRGVTARASADVVPLSRVSSPSEPFISTDMLLFLGSLETPVVARRHLRLSVAGGGGIAAFVEGADQGFNPALVGGISSEVGSGPVKLATSVRSLWFDRKRGLPSQLALIPTFGLAVRF